MNADGLILNRYKLDGTLVDVAAAFELYGPMIRMAYIEKVSSRPMQGAQSTFTFGRSLGRLEAWLTAYKIPYEEIRPQRWMDKMSCTTGGDKNVTKQRAQQLWPDLRWNHAYADSALIAECCRRTTLRVGFHDTGNGQGNYSDVREGKVSQGHGDGTETSEAAKALRAFNETEGRG